MQPQKTGGVPFARVAEEKAASGQVLTQWDFNAPKAPPNISLYQVEGMSLEREIDPTAIYPEGQGAYKLVLTNKLEKPNPWDVQLHFLATRVIQSGKAYRMTLWLRSEKSNQIHMVAINNQNQLQAAVTEKWQKFTFEFKPSETKENADMPTFFLGNLALNSSLWIGRVLVEELPDGLTRIIQGTENTSALGSVICHLDFENDNWVKFSRTMSPVKAYGSELVPGKIGKAASITANGQSGSIPQPGNLDKARGTMAFWYKPFFPEGKVGSYLVQSGVHGVNPFSIWVWEYNGKNLRFDFGKDQYLTLPINNWAKNEWKHIAISWDSEYGVAIAVDGVIEIEKPFKWIPLDSKELFIGANQTGGEVAGGLLDDLLIFNVCLSQKQIQALYQGKLKYSYASSLEGKNNVKQRDPVFYLSFDTNYDSQAGNSYSAPQKNEGAVLTEGYRGKGVTLGKSGLLMYAGNRNAGANGTVSFWLKPDWEPKGNGMPLTKLREGEVPEAPHEVLTMGDLASTNTLQFTMGNYQTPKWKGGGTWLSQQKQIFKDEWHHYVMSWSIESGVCAVYCDGKMLRSASAFGLEDKPLETIALGVLPTTNNVSGVCGTIDELKIFNYEMTGKEVFDLYTSYEPLQPALMDYCLTTRRTNGLRIQWRNRATTKKSDEFSVIIRDPTQNIVYNTKSHISIPPGGNTTQVIDFVPDTPGLHSVCIYRKDTQLRKKEFWVIDGTPISQDRKWYSTPDYSKNLLIDSIDCTHDYGPEKYRDDLHTKVVRKEFGNYREAETDELCGFAYRMSSLKHPGAPHWLEVEYPDDCKRTFFVVVLQEKYNHVDAKGVDTIGIITGGYYPNSMKMQKKRLLFWPDSTNIMVGCYSYDKYTNQSGPALSSIKVYENNGPLPVLKVNSPPGYAQRKMAIWQEDPTMPGYAEFSQDTMYDSIDLGFWHTKFSRAIQYMLYSGQNEATLLCFDYDGDTATDPFILPASWGTSIFGRIPGWADVGAAMLTREKIDFFVSAHDRFLNESGAFDDLFGSAKAQDMFEIDRLGEASIEAINKDNTFTGKLNPLHPRVQEAYFRIVKAYYEKFRIYPNFKGIRFINGGNLFFSDITEGYDDYSIKIFEQDTGIMVPIDTKDKKRFMKRHVWLVKNAKEQWINWRCQKLVVFYQKMRDILSQDNVSRSFSVLVSSHWGMGKVFEQWPLTELTEYEYFRQQGLDFKMLAGVRGVSITPSIAPLWGRITKEGARNDNNYSTRYLGFSQAMSGFYKEADAPAAFIAYHGNLEVLPWQKPKIAKYWWKFGSWFGRENGPYHMFSTPQPIDRYYREFFTHLLAEYDPQRIIHGWWGSPDNGNIEEAQKFYAPFRALPAVKFIDIPGADDPVRIRYYNGKDVRGKAESFIYFVNRQDYSVRCTLSVSGINSLTELQANIPLPIQKKENSTAQYMLKIDPYELVCFRGDGKMSVETVGYEIPSEVEKHLASRISEVKTYGDASPEDGDALKKVYALLVEAFQNRKYSRVHDLLQSGPVLKYEMNRQH